MRHLHRRGRGWPYGWRSRLHVRQGAPCVRAAQPCRPHEQQRGHPGRHEVGDVDGWDGYDYVFLGYPIWWGDFPQVVKKFMDDHDWSGKTVAPFSSHLGSGWAGTTNKLESLCAGAKVVEGISISGSSVASSLGDVDTWVAGLGIA